jgi:hypothetical protein
MLLTDDSPTGVKSRLKDIVNVTVKSNKYSCKELGLVAVTDSEMGAAIRRNVEMRERLSDALGINRMKVYPMLQIEDKSVYEETRYSKAQAPKEADISEQE